jgi:hypothetical protein
MENNKNNFETPVGKTGVKHSKYLKYVASVPFLSWLLVGLIFTVSFAANAGTGPK